MIDRSQVKSSETRTLEKSKLPSWQPDRTTMNLSKLPPLKMLLLINVVYVIYLLTHTGKAILSDYVGLVVDWIKGSRTNNCQWDVIQLVFR